MNPIKLCNKITFIQLYSLDVIGANVGLAITQVISLIGMCNWGLRQTAELENLMISVERLSEYTELSKEPSLETDSTILRELHTNWPHLGAIKFQNVSLKYKNDEEYVLKNLNFSISPGVSIANIHKFMQKTIKLTFKEKRKSKSIFIYYIYLKQKRNFAV